MSTHDWLRLKWTDVADNKAQYLAKYADRVFQVRPAATSATIEVDLAAGSTHDVQVIARHHAREASSAMKTFTGP